MDKKKICWVTPDAFIDCDIDIIQSLSKVYTIHWIVLFGKNNRFKEEDFLFLKENKDGLSIEFIYNKSRARYPQTFIFYMKVRKRIKQISPDLIYFNVVPVNPYILPLYFWLPKEKTIVTAHDGRITESMAFSRLIGFWFFKAFQSVRHVNMFSKYQESFFNQNFPGKDITVIPLALKDFGKPTVCQRKDCIGFVFFGTIHFEKNLELLIEAANQLVDEGVTGFKVSINGMKRVEWNFNDKIRHPDYFELNICSVPNSDIPNIFAYNHYAVYPYKNMSQSGAIKCAFNYSTPVIVSDLPGFTDEVEEGVDGYIFRSEDIEDLKRVMKECIMRPKSEYDNLVKRMSEHIEQTYAKTAIVQKYIAMFNKLL